MELHYTLSGNGIPEITQQPVDSHVDNLVLYFELDGQEYITRLDDAAARSQEYNDGLNRKLDRIVELLEESVSENSLPEEPEETEPEPVSVFVTVSENTVSENTVSENAIMSTPLKEYSITDTLLVIIILLLIFSEIRDFLFLKGGTNKHVD